MMDISDPTPATTPANAMRVLVLQGGGALGSYQAGAYQALCHHDFEPEWIAGISIGAINAAIIAGNPREKRIDRLKEFWEMVSSPVPWNPVTKSDRGRSLFNETSAALIATFGVPGFFTPRIPPAPLWPQGTPQSQSYYDTAPLKKTLERLVDFDLISARGPLPGSLLEAAEREKDIRFSSRTRMNTDKNRQIHNARKALRELIGKLPDYLKNDPSVEILRDAAKESTVTVVHLIYRSKNYESSSKDYDFSHVGMVEHWGAGVRDVHLSMRHEDWLERPQSGETMMTYDLTGDGTETLDGKKE